MEDLEADNMETLYKLMKIYVLLLKNANKHLQADSIYHVLNQLPAAEILERENEDFIVKEGHYCLLDEGLANKRVFKRSPC